MGTLPENFSSSSEEQSKQSQPKMLPPTFYASCALKGLNQTNKVAQPTTFVASAQEPTIASKSEGSPLKFFADLAAGGVSGGISKTLVAQSRESSSSSRPRMPTQRSSPARSLGTPESSTASPVSLPSRALAPSGEATWPTL